MHFPLKSWAMIWWWDYRCETVGKGRSVCVRLARGGGHHRLPLSLSRWDKCQFWRVFDRSVIPTLCKLFTLLPASCKLKPLWWSASWWPETRQRGWRRDADALSDADTSPSTTTTTTIISRMDFLSALASPSFLPTNHEHHSQQQRHKKIHAIPTSRLTHYI